MECFETILECFKGDKCKVHKTMELKGICLKKGCKKSLFCEKCLLFDGEHYLKHSESGSLVLFEDLKDMFEYQKDKYQI